MNNSIFYCWCKSQRGDSDQFRCLCKVWKRIAIGKILPLYKLEVKLTDFGEQRFHPEKQCFGLRKVIIKITVEALSVKNGAGRRLETCHSRS